VMSDNRRKGVAIDCEKERWVAVGFIALALIGQPAKVQAVFCATCSGRTFRMSPRPTP
jgi:hypothetical protein